MATLRYRFVATLAAAVLWAVFLGSALAAAQSAYPPAPPTTIACAGGDVDAGTVAVGQSITVTMCGPWQPGSPVGVVVGTAPADTVTAGGDGAVTITMTPRTCGPDRAVATGPGAVANSGTATATATATFSVTCAPARSKGVLATTGADIAKLLLAALVLIVAGAALVMAHRRRAGAR